MIKKHIMLNMKVFFFNILQYFVTYNIGSLKFYIILFLSLVFVFIYVMFYSMSSDLIVCYLALEGALLSTFVLFGCLSFMFMDIRSLVFLIFLISIAACEIAIGLSFLVRYR